MPGLLHSGEPALHAPVHRPPGQGQCSRSSRVSLACAVRQGGRACVRAQGAVVCDGCEASQC